MSEEDRNELRRAVVDTATTLFAKSVTTKMLDDLEQGIFATDLWEEMAELGLTVASLPEVQGGLGSLRVASGLLRPAGYAALPLPLADALLAGWLASAAELDLPGGVVVLAPGRLQQTESKGDRLSGTLRNVPWGRHASAVVCLAGSDDELRVVVLPVASATISRGHNVAGEPRDHLLFKDVAVSSSSSAASPVSAERLREIGAAVRAAQMVGALERVLDMTVEYAKVRVQFGKPIAKFQAIQQQIAILANHTAASLMAAERALDTIERESGGRLAAMAKVRVGEAAGEGARIAHQVHGAIGFTHEHVLHQSTRRLWAWRDEYGSEPHWARRLGAEAIEAGPDAFWDFVGEAA